jgi:hypothetical protein
MHFINLLGLIASNARFDAHNHRRGTRTGPQCRVHSISVAIAILGKFSMMAACIAFFIDLRIEFMCWINSFILGNCGIILEVNNINEMPQSEDYVSGFCRRVG